MKAPRREGDFYPTPQDVADRIVETYTHDYLNKPKRILEPSAGDGAFLRACRGRFPDASIWAVEPAQYPGTANRHYRGTLEDFACLPEAWHTFDLIIGNPPYNLAAEHVRLCLDLLAPEGRLVFLLRLGFLASRTRRALFREHPPERVDVLAERPSFSWTWGCGVCGEKWTRPPSVCPGPCPKCETIPNETPEPGQRRGTCTKTDAHDYAVITWRQGFTGETAMGWLP